MKKLLVLFTLLLGMLGVSGQQARLLEDYIISKFTDSTGREVVQVVVPGRPPDKHREPVAVPDRNSVSLTNVPGYNWSFGCSPTAAAMMAGYYDRTNYPNMHSGATNGGVAPMVNVPATI